MVNFSSILSKAERLARYRSSGATNIIANATKTVSSKVETTTAEAVKAARKAKYKQDLKPLSTDTFTLEPLTKAQEGILNNFQKYVGQSVDDIPVEDCIKFQELLVSTYRNGSIKPSYALKSKLPFLSDNPKEYLQLMEKLDERIVRYAGEFKVNQVTAYNSLNTTDKAITDFIHSLEGKTLDEAMLLINTQSKRLGLSDDNAIRLFRLFEARRMIRQSSEKLEHIAYRIGSQDNLKIMSLLEPKFCNVNQNKLTTIIEQVEKNTLKLNQTSTSEILRASKVVDIGGHKVPVCNADDIPNLSGYFHTPQGWGDSLIGHTENDIYRRFANFKHVFSKPTNGNPVCYTYGTNGKYPMWSHDSGFFVNIPRGNVHVGSTTGLGSSCRGLDDCINMNVSGSPLSVSTKLLSGQSIDDVVDASIRIKRAPEYLCTNGIIQAFYTNDIATMNKAYIELAEQYKIPIINLNGKGILLS
ncbi:MAG: hypothetical protein KH321_04375 [Clostridium sp.]|nr:hypothetical protein [Clostridium sp.]